MFVSLPGHSFLYILFCLDEVRLDVVRPADVMETSGDLCQGGLTFDLFPPSNEGDNGVLDIGAKGYVKGFILQEVKFTM